MTPKVSIIVPIYNVEQFLDHCMQTLLHQTLSDIEIIMVDDGSTDNCSKICDTYAEKDNRIKVIHKNNGGLGYARNSGLKIASGEFIGFVDSDDFVDNTMYEIMYSKAIENNSDIVYCNNYIYKSDIKKVYKTTAPFINDKTIRGDDVVNDVLKNMIASSPNKNGDRKYYMSVWRGIFKREIINNIFFVSEREYLSEDIFFQTEVLQKAQSVTFVRDYLYYYRQNSVSLTHKYRRDRIQKSIILYEYLNSILKNIINKDCIDWNNRLLKLLYGYFRFSMFSNISANGDIKYIKEDFNLCCDYFNKISFYSKYPIHLLPKKHKLILFLFKNRMFYCLYFLAKLIK